MLSSSACSECCGRSTALTSRRTRCCGGCLQREMRCCRVRARMPAPSRAATGVGGIIRDVIAMGARPIALLDSLRFGPLPGSRHHFDGVVAGIGGYGNCIGIPTVGGEVYFDECYANNPIVNAMCVGLVRVDRLMR